MSTLASMFDSYERRARLYPMLLVLMPFLLGSASWLPPTVDLQALAGSVIVGVALAAFLSQLARDQGKRKEGQLFRLWGGKPSVQALSYFGGVFDHTTLTRYHRKLNELDRSLGLPQNASEESANREHVLAAYESANELLLSCTRDRAQFKLVFEENVNYGYRRNLWAMWSVGVAASLSGVLSGTIRIVQSIGAREDITATALVASILCACLFVLWIMRINPKWVRVTADAYARQLVSASELLSGTQAPE